MTVKCVNASEKHYVARAYAKKHKTTQELANALLVSTRTINRVVKEMGVEPHHNKNRSF